MNLKQLLGTLGVMSVFLSGHAMGEEAKKKIPVYLEIDNYMDLLKKKIDPTTNTEVSAAGLQEIVYANASFKINDRYTVIPETSNTIGLRANGDGKFSMAHNYFRILVSDGGLAKWGDFSLGMTYRYTLPTTQGLQQAGSFGTLMFRPSLKYKINPTVTLVAREAVSFGLVKNAYQLNPPIPTDLTKPIVPSGNTIFSNVAELWAEINLPHDFYFQPYYIFINALKLGNPARGSTAATGASWATKEVEQIYEFGYGGDKLAGISLAIGYDCTMAYGAGTSDVFFNTGASFYLKAGREF